MSRARPHGRGRRAADSASSCGDRTSSDVAEFEDDRRRYVLVIEEGC